MNQDLLEIDRGSLKILISIIQYIVISDHPMSNVIKNFWLLDSINDPLRMNNLKYYTESKLNLFQRQAVLLNNIYIFEPRIDIDQNLIQQDIFGREVVQINYGANINNESLQQRGIGLYNLFQQLIQYFQNSQHYMNVEQIDFMNWLLQSKVDQNQQEPIYVGGMMQQDQNIVNSAFTIQSIIQYSGLSDCDFVKASFIMYLILAANRLEVNGIYEEFLRDRLYFTIKIGQFMQRWQQQQQRQAKMNVDYFLYEYMNQLSTYEQNLIQQQLGIDVNQQNNFAVIDKKAIFILRPGFGLLFGPYKQVNSIPKESQMNHIAQQFQVKQIQDIEDQEFLSFEQSRQYIDGIYTYIQDILFEAVRQKLVQYLAINNQQVEQLRLIIAITIQIPFVEAQNQMTQQQQQAVYQNQSDLLDLLRIDVDAAQNIITNQQLRESVGLSNYFTVSFTYDVLNYSQDLIKQVVPFQVISDVKKELCQNIIFQLSNLLNLYDQQQNKYNIMRLLCISYGIHRTIVRKIMIRPISVFQQNNQGMQNAQQIRQLLNYQVPQQQLNFKFIKDGQDLTRRVNLNQRQNPFANNQLGPGENVRKMNQLNSVIQICDYNAEIVFNDFNLETIQDECIQRTGQVFSKIFNEDIFINDQNDLESILFKLSYNKYLKYRILQFDSQVFLDQSEKANKEQDDGCIIIYGSSTHIFMGSIQRFKEVYELGIVKVYQFIQRNKIKFDTYQKAKDKIMSHNQVKNLQFFPAGNLYRKIQNKIFNDGQFSLEMYYFNRIRINVFFDFETTFDESNIYKKRGFKQSDDTCVREQTDFAFSLVCDIKLKLKRIIQLLQVRYDRLDIDCDDYVNLKRISEFYIPSSAKVIEYLNEFSQSINICVEKYNKILLDLIQQDQRRSQFLQNLFFQGDINCYSYNGSKFDNHFIVQQYKQRYGKEWINHVQITGDINDIKIMKVDNFKFYDLKLMTAGQSLKQFCEDLQIDEGKKEISMDKMKTLDIALKNKDEILEYVLYDSIAIQKIHKKFMKSVLMIVSDYCFTDAKFSKEFSERSFMNHLSNSQALYKCLVGSYKNWSTISSLSRRIFFDYFNKHMLQSSSDEQIYNFCKQSYQGGYTQSFLLGRVSEEIFYLDYNSMYPAIMNHTQFFKDLSKSTIKKINRMITRDNVFDVLKIISAVDRLQINNQTKCYALDGKDYFLYKLSYFKFKAHVAAPFFGIMTKQHGTIYPLEFDQKRDGNDICIIVFGFQLGQGFYRELLDEVYVEEVLEFHSEAVPIFAEFDNFMYNQRMEYKKSGNVSMALGTKIFMNSLYGKFGEKIHDVRLFMTEDQINDEEYYKNFILHNIEQLEDYKFDPHLFKNIEIKQQPVYDLMNDKPTGLVQIQISNVQRTITHIGSFVYYASLITAIGRQQITNLINQITDQKSSQLQDGNGRSQVYYADTDSVIINKVAFNKIKRLLPSLIDNTRLGAMKNEYPMNKDQDQTRINDLVVLNKKIYQIEKSFSKNGVPKDKKVNKFKGCKKPSNDMVEQFLLTGKYTQEQTRFVKKHNFMTIVDMPMQYSLRLSRKVVDYGQNVITVPYQSITEQHLDYQKMDSHVEYKNKQWQIIKN